MAALMAISRRALLAGAGGAVGMSAAGGRVAAEEKVSKTEAHYQDRPNGQQRCEICLQFQPPSTCRIVAGPVTPHSWCQFFAAKENAH
jgi:hypothetical protein